MCCKYMQTQGEVGKVLQAQQEQQAQMMMQQQQQ